MSLFCRHKWSVVHHEEIPSAIENLTTGGRGLKLDSWSPVLADHKVLTILACERCGELNKTLVSALSPYFQED